MAMLPNPLPKLAADPGGAALGLRLPPGTLVDQTDDGPWHEPLLWLADGPAAPGAWAELLPARSAGLHPVVIEFESAGPGGPADWELIPGDMSYPGDHDAEEVLSDAWTSYIDGSLDAGDLDARDIDARDIDAGDVEAGHAQGVVAQALAPHVDEDLAELIAPFDVRWPGLAEEGEFEADPDDRAAETAAEMTRSGWFTDPRVALVHARRSADIPAAIGWAGPTNHESDVAVLCAVLRSWEDRFGIRVIGLSFDRLTVSVAAPPKTLEEAEAVAAEHFAFCPDNITQGNQDSLREYAKKAVLGMHAWNFWWD
jgi:hypothetical protein